MIKIKIKPEWLTQANEMALEFIAAVKKANEEGSKLTPRFQTNELENKILGYLGEIALKDWLTSKDIFFGEQRVLGKSDEYDLLINGVKVDVKTELRKFPVENIKGNFKLMIQKDQVGLHGSIVFWVLAHGRAIFSLDYVYLVGFLRANKIRNYGLNEANFSPCYWIPFEDVVPPEEIEWIE